MISSSVVEGNEELRRETRDYLCRLYEKSMTGD